MSEHTPRPGLAESVPDQDDDVPTRVRIYSSAIASGDTVSIAPEDTAPLLLGSGHFVQVVTGGATGKLVEVPVEGIVIGRAAECGLCLEDVGISRRHAQILSVGDGRATVEDLGSTNGTFIGGRRIRVADIADGDRFQLAGAVLLRYMVLDRREQSGLEQLYQAATRDALTGVLNRRHLDDRLNEEFAFSKRHDIPLSIVLFDVDRFKTINDTYGHTPAGDEVLAHVAGVVRRALRTEDVFGRFGGEEFLVIAKGIGRPAVVQLAERIRQVVASAEVQTADMCGKPVALKATVSLGTATCEGGSYASTKALLAAADRALYQAKTAGRNRVHPDQPLPHATMPLPTARQRIGSILLKMRRITSDQLQTALREQKAAGGTKPLGTILVESGCCTAEDVAAALAIQYGTGGSSH